MDESLRKLSGDERIINALQRNEPVTAIVHDPDINGATVGQALLLAKGVPWLTPDHMDEILLTASSTAHKLGAMRYHCKNFETIQNRRLQEITIDQVMMSLILRGVVRCERDLLYEFEGFHLQFKSCLDILVKLLSTLLHIPRQSLQTYGDSGQKIIKLLEEKKKHKKLAEAGKLVPHRLDGLIELISTVRDQGFDDVIQLRNTVSHYRVLARFGFTIKPGIITQVTPPIMEVAGVAYPALEVMINIFRFMMGFVPEFIARTFTCTIPKEPAAIRVLDKMEKRYIGALWDIDLTSAIWGLSSDVIMRFTEDDIERARATHRRLIVKPGEL